MIPPWTPTIVLTCTRRRALSCPAAINQSFLSRYGHAGTCCDVARKASVRIRIVGGIEAIELVNGRVHELKLPDIGVPVVVPLP